MKNFRQFRGEQSLSLETTPSRPVVLVFGANGSGKTTLLSAFSWALYGEVSDDVEEQDRMVNDDIWQRAAIGDRVEMEVELEFEHAGDRYRARRSLSLRKAAGEQQQGDGVLELWKTTPEGASQQVAGPQTVLDGILPRQLSRFFFFNGERIDKLVKSGTYVEVRKDVKILLGLETVERAISHLPKVERKLGADVRKYGGDRASKLQEEIDAARDVIEAAQNELERHEYELEQYGTERESVEEALREHAAAAPIQRERDRIQRELEQARIAVRNADLERRRLVTERGFLAFAGGMAQKTAELAQDLYEKGALPAPLKREFVENLVEQGECICGTPLTEGSVAWQKVTNWRERAGLVEVETAWQRLGGQVDQIDSARTQLRESLARATKRLEDASSQVEKFENQLSERNAELERIGKNATDVGVLEDKRKDLDLRLAHAQVERAKSQTTIAENKALVESLERQLAAAEVKDDIAAKAKDRVTAVSRVQAALEEILAIREDQMRTRLDAQIKKTFKSISMKPYEPDLSGDFDLRLYQVVNGTRLPVGKSTGENQILSLSFVASVSKLAQEVQRERSIEEATGDWGEYPIVMDAAFGSLDESYQREVSRALGEMAPQLLVLVSKSQGLGEVYKELQPRLGRTGVIVAHSSAESPGPESIALMGREFPYFQTGEDSTWSELREVAQ